jgi:hypothetical protein
MGCTESQDERMVRLGLQTDPAAIYGSPATTDLLDGTPHEGLEFGFRPRPRVSDCTLPSLGTEHCCKNQA